MDNSVGRGRAKSVNLKLVQLDLRIRLEYYSLLFSQCPPRSAFAALRWPEGSTFVLSFDTTNVT